MDINSVVPCVLLLDGGAYSDHLEAEARASATHEGSHPAVAKNQCSLATQQYLEGWHWKSLNHSQPGELG